MAILLGTLKRQALPLFFLLVSGIAYGQQTQQDYFQGYAEEINGQRFGYHSPLPDVTAALLLRGQADYVPIEWETAVVPANYRDKYSTFIWLFGMDVTSSPVDFQLSINGREWFSFSSSKTSDLGVRKFQGPDGAELILNVTMLDKYNDQMGFAIMKIPTEALEPGAAAHIKVATTTIENAAWFMTFKTSIEEKITLYQNKVVAKKAGKLFHSLSADFIHIGDDAPATVVIGDLKTETILKAGFNKVEVYLPKVDTETTFTADIKIAGKKPVQKAFTLRPVREWEIFLVQHTHTDIGYTRPQTEILPEHLRYIDMALDFCDQTDDYPDDAKFRWTCETSWSVKEYLKSRPKEQINRLLKRIKENRLEATGMFLNFSEIIDEAALADQTKTLRLLKNAGITVTTAMQNDVNGIGWAMVDYARRTDLKYLTMGIHAHRARRPFDKPTSFWWQSPAGNRLLAYRSEHYQHGNAIGITSGQQDVLRNNLSYYLTGLEEKGYPYDKVSLQFSGYVTDNSPPSTAVCNIIKDWNEKYEWPKLRSALARDFMDYLAEQHAGELPVQEVAWPDWWTDGVGSAANETKEVRKAQMNLNAITALASMGKILGLAMPADIQPEIEQVYENLLFYDEHTHGAAESVTDPLSQNTINQWGMKAAYAWEAAKKSNALEEKVLAFLEPGLTKSDLPVIAVFNTLNWKRSGMVHVFLQNAIANEGADFTITDAEGREVPCQRFAQRAEGAYFGLWVEDVPPMGYKTLQVITGQKSRPIPPVESQVFENNFYRISIDENKGIVTRIFDKALQLDLIDPNDTLSLGQLIYEELANRHEMERLTNTNRDTVYKPLTLTRTLLRDIKITKRENGAIYNSIFLNGALPDCADARGVTIEIRLYHFHKKIEFLYQLFKLPVTTPEGLYVAFPFKLNGGKLAFDVQGGIVYPGINQLEGSASDWNTIQHFAAVKGDDAQIVFASPEIPLVQFGDINTGRYYYRLQPKTNHMYSWVLNNYWVTNFKASQEGELQWHYSITSEADNSDMFATKFGWSEGVPLKSRIILPRKEATTTKLVSRTLLNIDVPNLLLVNTRPSADGTGIVLQLREVEGDHAVLDIRRLLEETGARSAREVNVLEEELEQLTAPVLIEHFETRFIKLNFE
ncbi:MAG: glycoside hydrolase family 38 C-terminal domain-containing protein [Saprospiraceae bacterium]